MTLMIFSMMKKIKITLLALCAVALTGCEEQKTQEQIDAGMASHITEFNYKGHRYLKYDSGEGKYSIGGITHDPDCPCYKINSER